MWSYDGGLLAAMTAVALACAFLSPLTQAFAAGCLLGVAVEERFNRARNRCIAQCLEQWNERLKAETERCHWEIMLLRRSQDASPVLGPVQDTAATARAVDEAVSCDHDSPPASLHSSEMRSMMPTIANGEL